MKKFTKLLEDVQNIKFYKINAEIELIINAENEGEAGYLADSILDGIEEQFTYTILNIEETDDRINESSKLTIDLDSIKSNGKTTEEQIELAWSEEFGDKKPSGNEWAEWYHQMRKAGYDGIIIFDTLKNKI
jgi:hypothetical protein